MASVGGHLRPVSHPTEVLGRQVGNELLALFLSMSANLLNKPTGVELVQELTAQAPPESGLLPEGLK